MKDYTKEIERLKSEYPPEKIGGCFLATRDLINKNPELKEKIYTIKNLYHCVALTPDNKIIDTQIQQFCLLGTVPRKLLENNIFEKEEYEKLIGEIE